MYRRTIEEFDRLKALRPGLPNEPMVEPEPEQTTPVAASETDPSPQTALRAAAKARPRRPHIAATSRTRPVPISRTKMAANEIHRVAKVAFFLSGFICVHQWPFLFSPRHPRRGVTPGPDTPVNTRASTFNSAKMGFGPRMLRIFRLQLWLACATTALDR